jgi:hypothetical protein
MSSAPCVGIKYLEPGSVGERLPRGDELDDVVADGEQPVHLPPPHGLLLRRERLQPPQLPEDGGYIKRKQVLVSQ